MNKYRQQDLETETINNNYCSQKKMKNILIKKHNFGYINDLERKNYL